MEKLLDFFLSFSLGLIGLCDCLVFEVKGFMKLEQLILIARLGDYNSTSNILHFYKYQAVAINFTSSFLM